jgi:hypothetical protein
MLTPIDDTPVVTGATAQADKQIGVTGNNHAVLYTVPEGRVFTGWVGNTNPAQGAGAYLVVDGTDILHFSNFFQSPTTNMAGNAAVLTLLAGTSAKAWNNASYYTYVFGVESDA